MKKGIAVILAGVSLLAAPSVYADPVKLTGDMSFTYENNSDDTGTISTLTLKGEMDLGSGWTLYARLGAQGLSKAGFGDFNTDGVYDADDKSVISLDQFGFVHQKDDFTYKIGRQDAAVGTTSLLYSRAYSNIGKKAFVDGVSVAGKSGITNITALLAREDNPAADPKNKIYAVRAGFSPLENVNYGVTLGRYQDSANGSTNHWAVDGTYTLGKASLTGEYTKSNRDTENTAYATTLNYDFDGKTAAYITGFRVEANGDMGGQSDFDNNQRGIHYGVTRTLKHDMALELVYKAQKEIDTGNKNSAFEATISYSF